MKKSLSILVLTILAAIIVYGGSGVNVYFSCGDACLGRNNATSLYEGGHCGDTKNHQKCGCAGFNGSKTTSCCPSSATTANNPHHKTPCKVERVTVNWQMAQSEKLIADPASLNLFSDFIQLLPNNFEIACEIAPWQLTTSQKPPNLSESVYFSLLNFLII